MNIIEKMEQNQLRECPDLRPGLTVRVHVKIREGEKERIQVFEGVVIAIRRGGPRATFTVRKVSFGQGEKPKVSFIMYRLFLSLLNSGF